MIKIVEKKKEKRLVSKKNWRVWLEFASGWKKKKLIDPIKWQRKIRAER